jgi:fumarate reductase subunit C
MTTRSWWDSSATFKRCTIEKVSFVLLNQVDLTLTLVAMHLGFDELNPFVGFLLEIPVLLVVAKVILPLLIAWLMPGRLLWPSIALLLGVAAWNVKELIAFLV